MSSSDNKYDAIVVGTGPGGGIIARDLVKYGKKVLILERGDDEPTRGKFSQMLGRGWIPGSQLPVTYSGKPIVRGITTGGTSNIYTATAYTPDFDLLERFGVNIRREVDELRNELPIAPIEDRLMNPAASLFMQSANELGYPCKKLDKFIYQDKCLRNCDNCILGCPNEAKWNSRMLIDEAVTNGAAFINRAMVKKILISSGSAFGIEYKCKGTTTKAYGEKIIISAGGIGTPLLLRKSGFSNVGEHFCTDPAIVVYGEIPNLKGTGKAVPMMTGFHLKEEGIMLSDLHVPRVLKSLFDIHAFNFGEVSKYDNVIPVMVKVRDDLSGKIIGNGLVDKPISKADQAKLDKGREIAKQILLQAGAVKTYSSRPISPHPAASVKIGEHLDENLKTKFANLYVCDASAYPAPLGLPPTLTILGMGKRLAKHLVSSATESSIGRAEKSGSVGLV